MEGVITLWNQRTLTLKGRITVFKSLIASQLVYISSCVNTPKKSIVALENKIMRFIWHGGPPKVSNRILCQTIDDRGLNGINLEFFCKSLKLAWITRICLSKHSPWRQMLQASIGIYDLNDLLQTCLGRDDIK